MRSLDGGGVLGSWPSHTSFMSSASSVLLLHAAVLPRVMFNFEGTKLAIRVAKLAIRVGERESDQNFFRNRSVGLYKKITTNP